MDLMQSTKSIGIRAIKDMIIDVLKVIIDSKLKKK